MYINTNKFLKTKAKFILMRVAPIGLATTLLVGCVPTKDNSKKEENSIGYTDISLGLNFKVKDNNFVILNVGDSKERGVSFFDEKVQYCNEKDISMGIIVTPTSINTNDIYDDVELIKGIIESYEIDFPVYFNIDPIVLNNDINSDMKVSIIKMFLDKCLANGIYAGLYGKDNNLIYLKKYCGISDYDAFVVMEDGKDEVYYDGIYNLYQDNEGKIFSKINLAEVIESKKLNKALNFVSDGAYVVSNNESLLEIAMKYNISVNALLEYNNMKEEDFKEGLVIRIPSYYNCVVSNNAVSNTYKKLKNPILGCDMSYAQESINWNEIKDNFEFVILRSCFGAEKDITFDKNSIECSINNIPFGVYCFNNCRGIDYNDQKTFEKSLIEQADSCLEIIANKNVTYPVYFDLEVYEGEDIEQIYSEEQIKIMLDLWYDKVSMAGYIPGLYCNMSAYKYITNCYDTSDFEIWIAGGDTYDYEVSFEQIEAPNETTYEYNEQIYEADMFQPYQYVTDAGASNDEGYLDINYSYVDYSNIVLSEEEASKYIFDYKKIERDKFKFPTKLVSGLAISGSAFGLGYVLGKKRKRVKRRKKAIIK